MPLAGSTYFYDQAWWSGKPVLHLLPHWNWPEREGREIEVWCHTNLERVELPLNGRSLGTEEVPHNSHLCWKVKYAPGVLEARGFQDGRQVLTAWTSSAAWSGPGLRFYSCEPAPCNAL